MELKQLSQQIQVKLHQYCYKFGDDFSKPDCKFIRQMHFGILKSGSVQLSSISRSLSEVISHKKTTERLGRHLGKEGLWSEVTDSLLKTQRHHLRRCQYIVFDLSDISKRYAKKMEGLGKVHDGSEKEIANGYWLSNVVGVDHDGDLLVPAYSELYSHEMEVTSENQKILEAIDRVSEWSDSESIYVIDRGGDRRELITPLLSVGRYFVIRQTGNRHIYYRGEKMEEKKISRKVRLTHRFEVTKRRKNRLLKAVFRCGAVPVQFTKHGKKLYFVVIQEVGKGYCWLLCHLPCSTCEEAIQIAFRGYGHRWKIEEVHRQVKNDYHLEDICLQRYQALKSLNAIFWSAVSFLYTRLDSLSKEIIFHPLLSLVKKVRLSELFGFIYYKLALGLRMTLAGSRTYRKLFDPPDTNQLTLNLGGC
jgi:hypothetical protein